MNCFAEKKHNVAAGMADNVYPRMFGKQKVYVPICSPELTLINPLAKLVFVCDRVPGRLVKMKTGQDSNGK